MASIKYKANMKRKQMGSLTINNKSYPIYEGLNVIGRDIKATVLLKDVKFSKQHAIITVVDENTHFLSDFGSSNGTRLGNKCLIPYQLYHINDQERITFSDAVCLYHKITEANKVVSKGNLFIINEELSETVSQCDACDVATQNLPVETKVLSDELSNKMSNDSQNMHCAPTQKLLNIHEAQTQDQLEPNHGVASPTGDDDFIQATQDCDKPTQMLDVVPQDKSTEVTTNLLKQKQCSYVTSTQDEFSRTECYDDVFANETFRLSVNKHSDAGIEVDETVLVGKCNVTVESDNESVDMLSMNQLNNCAGVVADCSAREVCAAQHTDSVENPVKSVGDDVQGKETMNGDDSETDIEKSDSKKSTQLATKSNKHDASGSETDMEGTVKEKQVINVAKHTGDGDSETDRDGEVNKNVKRKKLRKQRRTAAKQISDADSETDIEASSKLKLKKKQVKTIESGSETDMDDNKSPTAANNETSGTNNKVISVDSGSETEIEDENELLLKIASPSNGTAKVTPMTTVKQAWSSSDEEIDLLAPTQKFSDSFTDKDSTQDKSKTNEDHALKTGGDNSSVPATVNADDAFEDDDFDLLVPTQLLQTNTADDKSPEDKMAEAPTQLLANPANMNETFLNSVAPTQLLVTASDGKITEEEINSEAPTQLLEPVKASSSTDKVEERKVETQPAQLLQPLASSSRVSDENEYLASTQLLDPAVLTRVSNEEHEELDSLAPTQLLQPVQTLLDKQSNEVPIDEAETQMAEDVPISAGVNTENEDSLAPTQLLKPVDSSSKQDNEGDDGDVDYLAPTQPLHLDAKSSDNEERSENVLPAPKRKLTMQSTPNAKGSSIKQAEHEEINDDFLVPTQKLSLSSNTNSSRKNVSFSEDMFAAPTQVLPRNEESGEEHTIFAAPTQKLTPRKSLGMKRRPEENEDDDDDFMAPTQLLTTNNNDRKSSEETGHLDFSVNDDPHYIHMDYSSDETSMRLAVSYNDDSDFCAPTQKLELARINKASVGKTTNVAAIKLVPEPETQFEVEFNLETQKLYVEAATSRPNNPLANMFGEEDTQLTEEQTQPVNLVSAERKTVTDSDQTMSSNVDTSDSSFQETRKKRSFEEDAEEEMSSKRSRNVKLVKDKVDGGPNNIRRTSKRTETVNSKYATANVLNRNEDVTNSPRKRGRKVEEKNAEDTTTIPSISKLTKKISDGTDEKSSENKVPETPRRMSRRGRVTEERELETPRKTPARRVKKAFEEEKQEMLKEVMQTNKSPEVKVMLTKIVEDVVSNEENMSIEPEENAKIEYKKPSDEQAVAKRQSRRTKKSETNVKHVVNTRTTRNKSNSNEESSDCKSSKENIGEFALKTKKPQMTRRTRGKQTKKTVDDDDDEDETVLIEDSDDSTDSNIEKYIRKKVLKIDYTDESCSGSSAASAVVPNPRHNKRSLKIEDYSSDENASKNENSTNSYTDTPNTKRRRYEPLNITTINNSQTSNPDTGPIKHKIVFTMLNNPELETTVKSLGGTTIDSVYGCTALVTNKITRSLKFLIAVSLGKPIVNTRWIAESVRKKMFLDPWNYLLEDAESENKFRFSLNESLQRARTRKLLTGYTVLLVVNKNFDVLKEIIETCGGKCVTRAPAKSTGGRNVVVVAYEDEKARYARYLKQKSPLTVVAAEAIFSGVLSQQLDFDSHVLT